MKLFKIVQKHVSGQCDAMRCKDGAVDVDEYVDGTPVNLCTLHSQDLKRYKHSISQISEPTQIEKPCETNIVPEGSLENILVSNLAVKTGAIESREETARQIHEVALAIRVQNIDTRDKADQLLSLIHEEDKALKNEVAAMYKPVKDAAKATKARLDSWFGPTLEFYAQAKEALKEKLGDFIRLEKAKEDVALATGDHDTAAKCVTDASENVRLKRTYEYSIINDGKNLPLDFLVPDNTKNAEIVSLLPRELLIPNHVLISALVKEHGTLLEIPDVQIIMQEEVQMKGKRK